MYGNSNLGRAINQNLSQLPSTRKVVNNVSKKYPHVFVGNEAFLLRYNLLKPFSRNALELAYLFNYRLLRTRRIIENAFGIATLWFRNFSRSICAKVKTAIDITKAVIILHNF